VINLLEALFPTSIDILKKERSNIDGFKPIILTDSNLNFLFTLLSGSQDSGDPLNGNIPLEFGCHQVIIVKDNESKTRVINPLLSCYFIKKIDKSFYFFSLLKLSFFFCFEILSSQQSCSMPFA